MGIHVDIGGAHEVLKQHIHTMTDVKIVISVILLFVRVVIVIVTMQVHSKPIKTMDLVEDIDPADIGIGTKAK